MPILHICNTYFEQELEDPQPRSLQEWFRSHPTLLQLQFLPLLYAAPEDCILVSTLPPHPDPRLHLLSRPPHGSIEHWGPSRAIEAWAKKYALPYPSIDWSLIQMCNSKIFSFSSSPQLPGAALLSSPSDALSWIEKTPSAKVLKTAFGFAGRGHHHIGQKPLAPFLNKQFALGLSVIGEPWVERLFDFSTQWTLAPEPQFLGPTVFQSTPQGGYHSTLVGTSFSPFEWALEEHLALAKHLLKKMADFGYRGNVGIDAYVYRWEGKERLQPIVEINGRKTMSWVALQVQQKQYPGQPISCTFDRKNGAMHFQTILCG